MILFHISNESGEVEYVYIAEDQDEVSGQLETGEEIVGKVNLGDSFDVIGMPTNRRLLNLGH